MEYADELSVTVVQSVPRQTNTNDCGVSACLNLAVLSEYGGEDCLDDGDFGYSFDEGEVFSRLARKLLAL